MGDASLKRVGTVTQAFVQPDGGWGLSNAGLVGSGLLVDTFMDAPRTRRLMDAVGGPVDVLVNTHHNGDHCYGNELAGAPRIIGHRHCLEALLSGPTSGLLASLMAAPDDGGAVSFLKKVFDGFEFGDLQLVPPNEVFDETLTLVVDGVDVRLAYHGPAHTMGDISVHVPSDGVVFCGDLVFNGVTPVVWEGGLISWVTAVERLASLDAEVFVPGHGEVCGRDDVLAMRDYLCLVAEQGMQLYGQGLDPLEAALRFDLGPYAGWVDAERIAQNVARLYEELAGQGPGTPQDPFAAFGRMAAWHSARGGVA